MHKWILMLIEISTFGSIPAQALRCNSKLIGPGDEMQKVLGLCGEPTDTYSYEIYPERPVYRDHTHNEYCHHPIEYRLPTIIEVWTYDFGPTQFIRNLQFENNRIISISRSRYGH